MKAYLTNLYFIGIAILLLTNCSKDITELQTVNGNSDLRSAASIKSDLGVLTKSLAESMSYYNDTLPSGITYNPVLKIVLEQCSKGAEGYYAISYEKLLNTCDELEIPIEDNMDTLICQYRAITFASGTTRNIINNNYHLGQYYKFHIVVPYLHLLANESIIQYAETIEVSNNKLNSISKKTPYFGFIYNNYEDWPISGLHVEEDDLIESEISGTLCYDNPVLISVFDFLPSNFYTLDDYTIINDCIMLENICRECPPVNTNVELPNIAGAGPAMDHEILIDFVNTANSIQCFSTSPTIVPIPENTTYAVVKAFPEFNYYFVSNGVDKRSVKKVDLPLYSFESLKYGDYLKICQTPAMFKVVGEAEGGASYSIAPGGIYSLTIPGATFDPVYFAFPFGQEIWYSNGPDMQINYSVDWTAGTCDEFLDVTGVKTTTKSDFYINNIISPNSNLNIVTTDFEALSNYWLDCNVSVGITTAGSQMTLIDNFIEFYATTPTTPVAPADLGSLLGELKTSVVGADTWYDIKANFIDELEISPGTQVILHVFATFENGEEINEYQYLTLEDNINPYTEVRSYFRGKILDYNVKVYSVL